MLLQEHRCACYSPPNSASKRPYSEKSLLPLRIALACPECQPCYPPTQKNHALFEQQSSSLPSQYSSPALALWQHSPGSCLVSAFCPGQHLRGAQGISLKQKVWQNSYSQSHLGCFPQQHNPGLGNLLTHEKSACMPPTPSFPAPLVEIQAAL